MLIAVEFDRQSGGGTKEVQDIRAERLLAAKAQSPEPLASQKQPKSVFGVGRTGTQPPSKDALELPPLKSVRFSEWHRNPSPKNPIGFFDPPSRGG
jgi:hypothetical protein